MIARGRLIMLIMLMFICIALSAQTRFSDEFNTDLSKWTKTYNFPGASIIYHSIRNDSLILETDYIAADGIPWKNLETTLLSEYEEYAESIKIDVSFRDFVIAVPADQNGTVDQFVPCLQLNIGDGTITIMQKVWLSYDKAIHSGYRFYANGAPIGAFDSESPADFDITFKCLDRDNGVYSITVVPYENGVTQGSFGGTIMIDAISEMSIKSTLTDPSAYDQYYDDNFKNQANGNKHYTLAFDKVYFFPDYANFEVTMPEVLRGFEDNDIIINVRDDYFHAPVANANVTVRTGVYPKTVYSVSTDENGNAEFTVFPDSYDPISVEIEKAPFFPDYLDEIRVTEYIEVTHVSELPVMKYGSEVIEVKRMNDVTQTMLPLANADITVTNNDMITYNFTTNAYGIADMPYYIDNTKGLNVIVNEDGYNTYEGIIMPYMWSYTNEATGPNNANHIIRNDQTGELFMTYTQHNPYPDPFVPTRINRVIGAYSDNDGEYWYLDDMGYGLNASVDLDIEGNPELFYDRVTGYYYNTFMLPTPSVVTNGSMWVAPGSMWHDSVNGLVNTAGIKYVDTEDKPYLVNAVFDANDPLNADVEVVIDYIGRNTEDGYLVIPHVNPSIALAYNSDSHLNDRLIAFEDKNSEICQIRYYSKTPEWLSPERKSFSLDLKSVNPHMDAFYNDMSLVWQEESAPGTDDYRIYLNDSRFFGDNTETNKQFPKVKRNQYISCVDNTNTAKLWYFKDSYLRELDIAVSTEGIYYPDFDIKTTAIPPIRTRHTAYYVYTEQYGDIYKIKTGNIAFTTNDIIQPLDNIVLSDTTEVTNTSPIYNYIPSLSRPVDRISSTITGLDYTKYYELKVNTTNNNKNEPYILMIDGNITEVIYGKENELLVPVDAEYLSDREITVSVDIVKGNPHRTVDIEIYQYDEVEGEGTGTIVQNNTLPFKSNETESTVFSVTNRGIGINGAFEMEINLPIEDIVKVRVYDIMGREVNGMDKELRQGYNALSVPVTDRQNNPLSKGVYFIKIQSRDNTYSGKLVNIK